MIKTLAIVIIALTLIQTNTAMPCSCGFPTCPQLYAGDCGLGGLVKSPLLGISPLLSCDPYKLPVAPAKCGGLQKALLCKPSICEILTLKMGLAKERLEKEALLLKKLLCCA